MAAFTNDFDVEGQNDAALDLFYKLLASKGKKDGGIQEAVTDQDRNAGPRQYQE